MLSLWRKTLVLTLATSAALGIGACTDSTSPNAPTELQPTDKNSEILSSYNPFKAIKVVGTWANGTVNGLYEVLEFVVIDGKLYAKLKLFVVIKTFDGKIVSKTTTTVYAPALIVKSDCIILKIKLGAVVKVIAGTKVSLAPCLLTVDSTKVSALVLVSLKVLLCDIAGAVGGLLAKLVLLLNLCIKLFVGVLIV